MSIRNDVQVGKPATVFSLPQSNLLAWSGLVGGEIAYANDTHQFGYYNPASGTWVWLGSGGGSSGSGIVDNLQGVPVSTTAPVAGQVLKFLGGEWAPSADIAGSGTAGGNGWHDVEGTLAYISKDDPSYVISIAQDMTGILAPGMRFRTTHGSTTQYWIITAVGAYSGGVTNITLLASSLNALYTYTPNSAAYSADRYPIGFDANPDHWTITTSDNSLRTQPDAVQDTWYNINSIQIVLPIGLWHIRMRVHFQMGGIATSALSGEVTLANATNPSSYIINLTGYYAVDGLNGTPSISTTFALDDVILRAAKATYYLLARALSADGPTLYFYGDGNYIRTSIQAVCGYL